MVTYAVYEPVSFGYVILDITMNKTLWLALLIGALAIPLTPFCSVSKQGVAVSHDVHGSEYLLLAPYRVNTNPNTVSSGSVYLMNRNGEVVHTWNTEAPVLLAKLQEDGSLFVSMTPSLDHSQQPGAGTTGILQKLSWDGDVLFEHRDPQMTIGFDVLPDGSVVYMRWEKTPYWFSRSVSTTVPQVWANELVHLSTDGTETVVWKVSDHVAPTFPIANVVPDTDFSHGNSVRYVAQSVFGTPVYVMSFRHLSTVYVVSADTGDVLWQSPQGMFAFQHDAHLLPEGTVLVFDNGFAREEIHALFSRAVEINTTTNSVVWEYSGGSTPTSRALFASSIMGAVDRLSNGNTLMTVSTTGRVYEVTPEGKVVWEYAYLKRDTDGEQRILFAVQPYNSRDTSWGARLLLPNVWASFCDAY